MEVIYICLCVLIIGQIIFLMKNDDDGLATCLLSILYWIIGLVLAFGVIQVLIPARDGLMRDYSIGTREGFVTKISETGIFWKTYEAQMQIGTGDMSALQAPFNFSVPKNKPELYIKLQSYQGKKVMIKYSQWLMMPFRIGSSSHELLDIEKATRKEKKG